MSLPAKTLSCHCCEFSTGMPYRHCPSCHSVAIHGVSDFSYRAIVLDVSVYEGTDQSTAVAAAQAGGGYVTISPILVDFRDRHQDPDFWPEMRSPRYGTAVVPLDAVRRDRQLDGAEYDPGRPPTPDYGNARAAALRATQKARHADGAPMSGFRAYGP